jgi:hypothetical protein
MTDVASKSDTLSRRLSEAHRQRLDTLSIQLRVVEALLKGRSEQGAGDVRTNPSARTPEGGVRHPMVADVAEFYVVLRELFDGSEPSPAPGSNRGSELSSTIDARVGFTGTVKLPSAVFDDLTNALVGS